MRTVQLPTSNFCRKPFINATGALCHHIRNQQQTGKPLQKAAANYKSSGTGGRCPCRVAKGAAPQLEPEKISTVEADIDAFSCAAIDVAFGGEAVYPSAKPTDSKDTDIHAHRFRW